MVGKYHRKDTKPNNIKNHDNKARTAPVMPMAGAIVTAAILLSGLSLIGSYQLPVIAQQEGITGTGVSMTGEGGGAQGNDSLSQIRMYVEEAYTALQNNDTQGALMHLGLALNALGNGNASGISSNITTGTNAFAGDTTPTIVSENPVLSASEASSANDDDDDDNDDSEGSDGNTDDEDSTERDTDEEEDSEDDHEASSTNDDDDDDNDDSDGSDSNTDDEGDSECGAVNIGGTSPADDYGCPPDDDGA
jgi:hypothetical protein